MFASHASGLLGVFYTALHLLNNETLICAGFECNPKIFFVCEIVGSSQSPLCDGFLSVSHLFPQHLLQLLTILVASAGPCSILSTCVLYWGAQNWLRHSGCVRTIAEQKGWITGPSAGCVGDAVCCGDCLLCHRAPANDAWV